jgi:hypothetical protein
MSDDPKIQAQDAARDYAWKHFDVHAKQRIEVFKCYLTLVTITFAGYGIAFQNQYYGLGIGLAFFSIVIAILFYHLDCRTRDLVKISEQYLLEEERRLSQVLASEKIRLMAESDRLSELSSKFGRKKSYTRIFKEFFVINVGFAIFVGFFFLLALSKQ